MAIENGRLRDVVLISAATVLLLSGNTLADDLCLLCGDEGVSGLKRPGFKVNSKGQTCTELALEMALTYNPWSDDCGLKIEKYGDICCGEEEPDPVQQTPTASPVYNGKIEYN